MEIVPTKRKAVTKAEAIERSEKLSLFMQREDVKEEIAKIKEHHRVNYIREHFAKDSGIDIPLSSIYKLLRAQAHTVESTRLANNEHVETIPIDS